MDYMGFLYRSCKGVRVITRPFPQVCPMHFFRTGLDIRPTHGSVLRGMQSVRRYNEEGLTGPGCW